MAVYKDEIEDFKPKTVLKLLNKLEGSILDSDFTLNPKNGAKLHYLKGLLPIPIIAV